MKGLVGVGLLAILVAGCDLTGNQEICRSERTYNGIEAYVVNSGGNSYITDVEDDLSAAIQVCGDGELTPPEDVGFNNIYSIDGKLVDECDKGQCITVTALKSPACEPEYSKESTDVDLYSQWYLSHIFSGEDKVYPSCVYNSPSITFNVESDSSYVTGRLGENAIGFEAAMIDDMSAFIPGEVSLEEEFISAYAKYIETQIANFFENQDTVYYQIDGNELTVSTQSGGYGLLFYNR